MSVQLSLLAKHISSGDEKQESIIGSIGNILLEFDLNDDVHNEEVCLIRSWVLGFWLAYQRSLENQGQHFRDWKGKY